MSTAYTGPLSAPDFPSLPSQVGAQVDKIEKESAANQKDVAIIHTPFKDTPSVQLGDSSTVHIQDTLTMIGFPGNADLNNNPTDLLTFSVVKIDVSSIKTTASGAPVIQVSGNVEHGDSGGPALDNQGNIVGIVSFGIANPNSPGSTNGTSFLQASSSASGLVSSLNLDTTAGTFQKLWSQAFTDYSATTPGHWHRAAQELGQLATNYPLFQGVKPYLLYAQAQAKTEPQSSSQTPTQPSRNAPSINSTTLTLLLPIALVVLLLLVVFLLLVLVLGNRRRKDRATSAAVSNPPLTRMPMPQQNGPNVPPFHITPTQQDTRTTFAPPAQGQGPNQLSSSMPHTGSTSAVLRPWPCGHLNRPNARFCSICGEPAPTTIRRENV
ncbi:MAG: trypsin-like peptidase domain-containing protein [Ktedonobacteraceae bacterium]|nr:trypsin-like peptidase domain-containing protein [Ktedonobacteraceae bacterium]